MKKFLFYMLVFVVIVACQDDVQVAKEMTQTDKPPVVLETSMQEQTAEVSVTVPDSLWSVSIDRVVQSDEQIAVIAQLKKADGMGMMVISQVSDAVSFKAKPLPIKYYIVGKTWNWESAEGYEFVSDPSELNSISGEDLAFTHIKPTQSGGPKRQEL